MFLNVGVLICISCFNGIFALFRCVCKTTSVRHFLNDIMLNISKIYFSRMQNDYLFATDVFFCAILA